MVPNRFYFNSGHAELIYRWVLLLLLLLPSNVMVLNIDMFSPKIELYVTYQLDGALIRLRNFLIQVTSLVALHSATYSASG